MKRLMRFSIKEIFYSFPWNYKGEWTSYFWKVENEIYLFPTIYFLDHRNKQNLYFTIHICFLWFNFEFYKLPTERKVQA